VDSNGHVLTYDGRSWSKPVSIDAGRTMASVSCPTASFCAAVDPSGYVLTYEGRSWSKPVRMDKYGLNSVSCPTVSFCAAVGQEDGNAVTYNGSSWSKPVRVDWGNGLTSVSCATASFCAAVDWWGSVYTYNGISWSSLDSIDPGYPGLESVSCPTTSFCAAVDYSDAFTYSSLATPKTALKLSAAVVTYGDEGVEHLAVTVSPQHSGTTPTGTMTIKTSSTTLCVNGVSI
jgi:hypothetical protein